ncbi:MAG TPA: efflux RND transporter periplasmic adaptor subunit [Caldilineae bacterium]|nr:efflux RND transporter periplasmic adaptor subunit [Caldilineae bacterium]
MPSANKTKSRKKWFWLLAGLAAVAVVFAGFGLVNGRLQQNAVDAATTDNIVTAFIGDLSSTATASGTVEAQREAQLSLDVAGTVDAVYVREGDSVHKGDVLVQLDTAALERAVANDEQNLIIQEANLAELQDGASDEDIASAQAAVASAQANLDDVLDGADDYDIAAARSSLASAQAAYADLLAGPDANDVAQAEANLRNAEASLQQAQADYDEVSWRSDIGRLPQSLALEQATNNYNVALAAYNNASEDASDEQIKQAKASIAQAEATLQKLLDSPTDTEIAAAKSQLAQAEATLASLLEGASEEKIAVAQAQVEQARINLEDARENLDKASLLAPFDGVITAVHVAEGERASGLAVELVDANSLEVVLSVDEVDIGELAVGQPAVITLETWPGEEISGEIVAIAPKALENASAIVAYEVRLSLGKTDLPIRVGMTANADLITSAKEGVLLVPNEAITADREAGRHYVNKIVSTADGGVSTERVEVTIGLKDDDYTEITSGIQEGDRLSTVIITTGVDEESGGFFPSRPERDGSGPFGR